jgi:hypothetical protein
VVGGRWGFEASKRLEAVADAPKNPKSKSVGDSAA